MATKRTVKLKGPAHITSMSVGGETFEVRDGLVEVPEEHVHALTSHGFERHSEPTKAAAPATTPAQAAPSRPEKARG